MINAKKYPRNKEKNKEYKRTYYLKNKEKIIAESSVRYQLNKPKLLEQTRNRHLVKYFPNLTPEEARQEYEQLLLLQNNTCAICKKPEWKVDQQRKKICNLAVDHCHGTGKVRGLLCFVCNTNLGRFEGVLDNFLDYLILNQIISSDYKKAS